MAKKAKWAFMVDSSRMIKIRENGWVYVIVYGSHEMEDTIGDISLAMDNNGNLYYSNTHPCTCIFLATSQKERFVNINEFIHSIRPINPRRNKSEWVSIKWE